MYSNQFNECLAFVLAREGGYCNDKDDPGGRTNKGIEASEYERWLKRNGRGFVDIMDITESDASAIYYEEYYHPLGLDGHSASVALCLFDAFVNMGIGGLASVVNQVWACAPGAVVRRGGVDSVHEQLAFLTEKKWLTSYRDARLRTYRRIVTRNYRLSKFMQGWTNRVMLCYDEAVKLQGEG